MSDPGLAVPGFNWGAVFVYFQQGESWVERMKLYPETILGVNYLGATIAQSGNQLLVGAPTSSTGGRAFLYSLDPNPVPEYGIGCPGSGGFVPRLAMNETYDGCKKPGSSLGVSVSNALGGSYCLLMLGVNTAVLPLNPTCSLLLVPSASNAVLPLFGSGPGSGAISINATIPAGFPTVSVYFQGFVPDSGASFGVSATNGLRMTVY